MRLLRMVGVFTLAIITPFAALPLASIYAAQAGTSVAGVVISQVQTGGSGTGTAGQEFIELQNNTPSDIDVTGWCVSYSSASDTSTSQIGCLAAPGTSTSLWLEAGKHVSFTSLDFELASGFLGDVSFAYAGGMSATSGHVRLLDNLKHEVDKVVWGAAANPEMQSAIAPAGGKSLQRKTSDMRLQDTNNNFDDFAVGATLPHASGLYEIQLVIDLCDNLLGAQETMPIGYQANGASCEPIDVCPNISGAQATVPDGYSLESGACQQDQCTNIAGLQITVPVRYSANNFACTKLPVAKLMVTELLPNPSGDDTASEFMELYNPGDSPAYLDDYRLNIGPNFDKQFALPEGVEIAPKTYAVIQSKLGYFTLVNTASKVQLVDVDGVVIDQSPSYANADDDMAWALIGDTWQYTNQPTPGSANASSSVEEESPDTTTTSLAPCGEGKYRNPLTNRCRNIEADAATLAVCESGEYRNPETNRCRKIVLATNSLTPCGEGQERNPETNRCRSVAAAASSLKPCAENQERNPETNRCRAVKGVSTTAKEPYAVIPTGTPTGVKIGWAVATIAVIAAVGYGAYEWRSEIGRFAQRLIPGKK